MTQTSPGRVTQIIAQVAAGDARAVDELLQTVYSELNGLADRRLREIGGDRSLRATDLVHEAYLRLVGTPDPTWESRRHFINAAGVAMRSILIDRARARGSLKRGGDRRRVPMDDALAAVDADPAGVLEVDEALARLEKLDSRASRVVALRFYLGLREDEIAEVLDITTRTVQRDWRFARAWLWRELAECTIDDADGKGPAHA